MRTLLALTAIGFLAAAPQEAKKADLAGHWKLDDGKGETAADAAGGGAGTGKLVGGPVWSAGRIGGALAFDGKDDYVELPNTPALENLQEGSYTISVWFKPENSPPGTESDNNSAYAMVVKTGWHEGLSYRNEGKFVMEHWLAGDEPKWSGAGTWDSTFDPGKFHHVAGVVDQAAGTTKIYVNGALEGTGEWDAGAKAREYSQTTWKIGIGNPGAEKWAWQAKGVIDDVRLYNRALSEEEIKALATPQ